MLVRFESIADKGHRSQGAFSSVAQMPEAPRRSKLDRKPDKVECLRRWNATMYAKKPLIHARFDP
ncbi:MAG: hypothetical protein P8L85_08675, partial [Rubripirellula sp.]|nr:hypothetical protein [Rubripirellula sp.]